MSFCCYHNAYPCKEEDSWCVIVIESEEEWRTFCKAVDRPELATDTRFCTLEKRKENENKLDGIVAQWTKQRTAKKVMKVLQKEGISAGVVQSAADLFEDPQLRHRGHFKSLEHPEIGPQSYEMPPFRLSRTPAKLDSAAPCLGQHTEYICNQLLGIPDEELVQLITEGVLE